VTSRIERFRTRIASLRASSTAESRALRSGVLAATTNVLVLLIKLVSNVCLARLLAPHDFGVSSLCFVVLTGVTLLSDVGLDTAVVRSQHGEDPKFLNVVWTIGIVRAIGMWAAMIAVAVPVANYYGEPILVSLIPVLGVVLLLEAGRSTFLDVCDRRLDMRPRMMLELRGQVLTTIVQLGVAFVWPSVWAIVFGAVTSSTYRFLESHRLNDGPRNRFSWRRDHVAEILHFGKWVFVSTAFTFAGTQGDRPMLGKLESLAVLGVYTIASTIALIPSQINGVVAARVVFPLISTYVRERPTELGARLRKARTVLLLVNVLALTGVIVGAGPFFEFIYKPEYRLAGTLAPLVGWISWISIVRTGVDQLPIAFGDSRLLTVISFVSTVARLSCGYLGFTHFGLYGFLGGLFVGSLADYATTQVIAVKRYGVRLVSQDAAYTVALALVSLAVYAVRDAGFTIRVGVGIAILLSLGSYAAVVARRMLRERDAAATHPTEEPSSAPEEA